MNDRRGWALFERVVLLALSALGIAFAGALSTFFFVFGAGGGIGAFLDLAWPVVLVVALFGGIPLVPLLLPTDLRRSLPIVAAVVVVTAPLAILLTGPFGLMVCYVLAFVAMLICNLKLPYRPTSASNSA